MGFFVALLARPLPPQSKNVVPLCRVNRSACTAARSRFSLRTFGFYVVEFQSLALLARLFHTLAVQQRAKEQVTAEPTSCQQKACGHSFLLLYMRYARSSTMVSAWMPAAEALILHRTQRPNVPRSVGKGKRAHKRKDTAFHMQPFTSQHCTERNLRREVKLRNRTHATSNRSSAGVEYNQD